MNLIFLFFCLLAVRSMAADRFPGWFPEPPQLPAATGSVVRVSTAEQILAEGEKLVSGGTLMIEPGVYRFTRPLVLSGKTNVVVRSASGEPDSVMLTGKGWAEGDEHDDLLHISHCDGVAIAGLTFAECRSYGIKVEAEHGPRNVHIYNCRFRNIGIRAIKGSAGQDPSVRAVNGSVRFCDFENTKVPPASWLFGGDYISAIDMMALENWSFSNNVFRKINGRNGGGRAAIFIWVRSTNIVVERNVIIQCDRGIAFGNPGQSTANQPGAQRSYVNQGIIRNNFISGGADCGIELWHVENIKVWHNSIWRPDQNFNRGIRIGTGTLHAEIVNNLVHGGIQTEGGQAEAHHNLAARLAGYFADPAAGDLALTSAAAGAIDQGASLTDVPRDIRGAARNGVPDLGAWEYGGQFEAWVAPMRKVHARFTGRHGTVAHFGDSITFSGAYWSPLVSQPKNLSPEAARQWKAVRDYVRAECYGQKGPSFGNQGSTTVRWAAENISSWLRRLNPEVAVIMFGSNDVRDLEVREYEAALAQVVEACLKNGTVVLLTTPPPQSARMEKCLAFAEAVRRVAKAEKVPLIDYCGEILRRRPRDWDGSTNQVQSGPADPYEVPTLISRDGVHPSNPGGAMNDFSEQNLQQNGYALRNYLTMSACAEVIREVLASDPF